MRLKEFLTNTKINRKTYLGFFLIILSLTVLERDFIIPQLEQGNMLVLGQFLIIFNIVLTVVSFTIGVFRLRDVGHSGWWVLLFLVPIANIIFPFYLLLKKEKYEQ